MEKKIIAIFCALMGMLFMLGMKLFFISTDRGLAAAAQEQSSYSVPVSSQRGMIYDCNMQPLVNESTLHKAVVYFGSNGISQQVFNFLLGTMTRDQILKKLSERKPFLINCDEPVGLDSVVDVEVKSRYSDEHLAAHIIGYTDSQGTDGLSGIEKAYNEILSQNGGLTKVVFRQNGLNQLLTSVKPVITAEDKGSGQGVVLTIDKSIQKITELSAEKNIQKGAVVVVEVATGDIKACVSCPSYDPTNIEASLNDPDAPFVNRAFSAYNVGSVFKLAVAAAALESGISQNYGYTCTGSIDIDGQIFRCNDLNGHGYQNMKQAMEQSCNTYFINLGLTVGYNKVYAMASAMGIGTAQQFAAGFGTAAGVLPTPAAVKLRAAAANISFGQGELLATPTQIAQMVLSIANGGVSTPLNLVKGISETSGKIDESMRKTGGVRVMSEATAAKLREFMIGVVKEGSGTRAQLEYGGAGGKTSSAQTGKYNEDGTEIVHAWFAGFFPEENPKYVVVIISEGGLYGGRAAAPVFKDIAEGIHQLGLY